MKNLLHKILCGLLITLCFLAGAYTLHPLQVARAIALRNPSLAAISHQTFLLPPIESSTVKAVAATNTINLSRDKKVKPLVYKDYELGELERSMATGSIFTNQQLPVIVSQKPNACLACECERGMIDFQSCNSSLKYSMQRDHSKDAVNISYYKDRTILYAKVVC